MLKTNLLNKKLTLAAIFVAVFGFYFLVSPSVSAAGFEKDASHFPSEEAYDTTYNKGKEIGDRLCEDRSGDKQACAKTYAREYVFLAWKTCESRTTESSRERCFTEFVQQRESMGRARAAAGYDPDRKITEDNYDEADIGGGAIGTVGKYRCGNYDDDGRNVKTKFNFGCLGDKGPKNISPIEDFAFAIIRFLSIGVGIAVVISIILAGIQYASSAGVPETTGKAKNRIQNSVIALFIYIFTFAILQYFIPGGILNPSIWLSPDILKGIL